MGVKRREAYRQPPPPREEGPRPPRCQGEEHQVDFSEKQAAPQGLGHQACPSEFSGLNRSSEMGTQRPSHSWGDLSKVNGTKPWHRQDQPGGSRPGSLLLGPGEQRLIREGGPHSGLHRTHVEGPAGPQGAGHGEKKPTQGLGLGWEASFSFPFVSRQQADHSPDPLPGTPKETTGVPLTPSGSCSWEGQLHTWLEL